MNNLLEIAEEIIEKNKLDIMASAGRRAIRNSTLTGFNGVGVCGDGVTLQSRSEERSFAPDELDEMKDWLDQYI